MKAKVRPGLQAGDRRVNGKDELSRHRPSPQVVPLVRPPHATQGKQVRLRCEPPLPVNAKECRLPTPEK